MAGDSVGGGFTPALRAVDCYSSHINTLRITSRFYSDICPQNSPNSRPAAPSSLAAVRLGIEGDVQLLGRGAEAFVSRPD